MTQRERLPEPASWRPVSHRFYQGPEIVNSETPDFIEFAEQSRARWDVLECLKVKIKRLLNKGTPTKKA
jgi:hypothetical protein